MYIYMYQSTSQLFQITMNYINNRYLSYILTNFAMQRWAYFHIYNFCCHQKTEGRKKAWVLLWQTSSYPSTESQVAPKKQQTHISLTAHKRKHSGKFTQSKEAVCSHVFRPTQSGKLVCRKRFLVLLGNSPFPVQNYFCWQGQINN